MVPDSGGYGIAPKPFPSTTACRASSTRKTPYSLCFAVHFKQTAWAKTTRWGWHLAIKPLPSHCCSVAGRERMCCKCQVLTETQSAFPAFSLLPLQPRSVWCFVLLMAKCKSPFQGHKSTSLILGGSPNKWNLTPKSKMVWYFQSLLTLTCWLCCPHSNIQATACLWGGLLIAYMRAVCV